MYINTSEEKPNNDEADKSYNAPAKKIKKQNYN